MLSLVNLWGYFFVCGNPSLNHQLFWLKKWLLSFTVFVFVFHSSLVAKPASPVFMSIFVRKCVWNRQKYFNKSSNSYYLHLIFEKMTSKYFTIIVKGIFFFSRYIWKTVNLILQKSYSFIWTTCTCRKLFRRIVKNVSMNKWLKKFLKTLNWFWI